MKFMNNNYIILTLLLITCLVLIVPVSATITVNASDVGLTYIQWTWDPGLNLSDMFIDGNVMCGYETTSNTFTITGLDPCELHTIVVLTDIDTGSNSTYTLCNSICPNTTPTPTPTVTPTPGPTPNIPPLNFSTTNIVSGNSYVSMKMYYTIIGLFSAFIIASLFLDGRKRPFEKLFAAIMAFIVSVGLAVASFSLAIISYANVGSTQQELNNITSQQQSMIPTIIMQNTTIIQIATWILVILCFINIINCILILIDYSRLDKKGVKKGGI